MTTSAQLKLGRRLLRILLPQAEERARTESLRWKPNSALGRAQAPYLRLANVDTVLIYQAAKGGWHGDVVLKEVPHGVPNVLGTPVENPCPTREMATDLVINLLAQIISAERAGSLPPSIVLPVFLFHGYEINLLSEILEQIPGYESVERALNRLEQMEHVLFPKGVPDDHLTLEGEGSRMFMAVIHMATKTGVFRYPPMEDREPTLDGPRYHDKLKEKSDECG